MTVHLFIRPCRFEEVLACSQRVAPDPDRYVLTPGLDGFRIWDRGELISTFQGPDGEPALAHLRRLQAEEGHS